MRRTRTVVGAGYSASGTRNPPTRETARVGTGGTSMSVRMVSRHGWLLTIGAIVTLSAAASQARAADLVFNGGVDSCTTLNCGAVVLNGIAVKNAFGDSVPFTSEVFGDVGNCIRLDVTAQSSDMEIVLVSPSGSVWRNDDRVSGDLRPLITARADVKGYYTVQINYYSGNQA